MKKKEVLLKIQERLMLHKISSREAEILALAVFNEVSRYMVPSQVQDAYTGKISSLEDYKKKCHGNILFVWDEEKDLWKLE